MSFLPYTRAAAHIRRYLPGIWLLMLCLLWPGTALAETGIPRLSVQEFTELCDANHGKVILFNFFASWCPPCRAELPGLVRLREQYDPQQVVFIGLSVDQNPQDLQQLLQDFSVNYPVYMVDSAVAHRYSVHSIPHNTLYDRRGKLIANQPGLIPEETLQLTLDKLVEAGQ